MFTPISVIVAITVYMALLFGIAQLVEKKISARGKPLNHGWAYALSLAVYHTSWTFYGSVGFAASSGLMFLGIYAGAIISILFWPYILKPMIQIKETYRITSIADFISSRYNRSQRIASLVTIIALVGAMPYIALQIKAIVSSFQLVTNSSSVAMDWGISGLQVTVLMIMFTIIFGVRRLDPTERHQGMIYALVAECIIKLLAFMAVGLFVTFTMFDGFEDILQKIHEAKIDKVIEFNPTGDGGMMWLTLIILSFAGITNLPRQFHVSVVENTSQEHVRSAMWMLPLYMILINLFVVPIAAGGLLKGLPIEQADYFVLLLPQLANNDLLTLIAFIGGFSAASGMVIITTMTLSTMASNHLILPIIEKSRKFNPLRRYLLQVRWALVTLILMGSYLFALEFSNSYILVAIGLLSFVAVLQFSPALLGGIFWKRGNSGGAMTGLFLGFMVWIYTLLMPTFIKHGWFSADLLHNGPLGIDLLRPEAILGLEGLHPVTHAVFWSLTLNIGAYIIGSLLYKPNKSERHCTAEFMTALITHQKQARARPTGLDAYIPLTPKMEEALSILSNYIAEDRAKEQIHIIADDLQVLDRSHITIIELLEFHRMVEHVLAGSIGAASAHATLEQNTRYTNRESSDLKALHSHLVKEVSSSSLAENITYEDDIAGNNIALIRNLQIQIDDLELKLKQKEQLINSLESKLDRRHEDIHKFRMISQKAELEVIALRLELEKRIHVQG